MKIYVPGTRIIGGTRVRCEPGTVAEWPAVSGVIAEPLVVRKVRIPVGSKVAVDCDSDDVYVTLPDGMRLRFAGRVLGFPGLKVPLWFLPFFLAIAWYRMRRHDGDVEVLA